MAKYLYNTTNSSRYYQGREIQAESFFTIPNNLLSEYQEDTAVLQDLATQTIKMSADGETAMTTSISQQIDFLKDRLNPVVEVQTLPAFASKTFGDKKLYKRVHGVRPSLSQGSNDIVWEVPYAWIKFMSIEIMGAENGDYCSLYVLDSEEGLITTVPNYVLNQFGFEANIAKDFYCHKSEFDADLYAGLQVKIVYNSVSAKSIGINFVMNELKD